MVDNLWLIATGFLLLILGGCASRSEPAQPEKGMISADVPAKIDPAARYLLHLHGRAVEVQGPNAKTPWGDYPYPDTLRAFADRGFIVISEARPATTQLPAYAVRVASQVAQLLAAGVAPDHIIVTGFSKGGAIAVLDTALIGNERVNFVLLGGCLLPDGGRTPADLAKAGRPPQGRILSMHDEGDTEAASCASNFAGKPNVRFKEIVFHEHRGHGLFLTPNKIWLDPAVTWAMGR
jgi:predicted esterase